MTPCISTHKFLVCKKAKGNAKSDNDEKEKKSFNLPCFFHFYSIFIIANNKTNCTGLVFWKHVRKGNPIVCAIFLGCEFLWMIWLIDLLIYLLLGCNGYFWFWLEAVTDFLVPFVIFLMMFVHSCVVGLLFYWQQCIKLHFYVFYIQWWRFKV